jgi:porphyrinogen peroxidase
LVVWATEKSDMAYQYVRYISHGEGVNVSYLLKDGNLLSKILFFSFFYAEFSGAGITMAREQFGICAEANLHGFMFLINALDGHQGTLRVQLARLHSLIQRLSDQFSESNLSAVIAIGAGYWDTLYPASRPRDLQTFPPLIVDDLDMPASPYDLFLQIRSDRYDVLHLAAQQCLQLLQPYVEIQEQVHAFRYMDGRDLTGFIDQPRAPKGKRKRELALVAEEVEPEFSGGSYLHFQRYRLDLNRWQQLTQSQQEMIMGYKNVVGTR